MHCSEKNIFYYGKSEDLPEKYVLQAGSLQVVYESGCLRYISDGETELIRSIYSAVRDRNWGTIIPVVENVEIKQGEKEFEIHYSAKYTTAEIDFLAHYSITGRDNTIVFSMHGKALKTFMKNRIGFCVLHPLEGVKGKSCRLGHPENKFSEILFPEQINPHSPGTNIISMEWENDAAICQMVFEGDVWEMEDHRNWTDSSYKTYCTPLSIPFPASINEGDEVNQKIVFRAKNKIAGLQPGVTKYSIVPEPDWLLLPELGTALCEKRFTEKECNILKETGLNFVRHDVKFARDNWMDLLDLAISNSVKLEMPVELVFHFTNLAGVEAQLLQKIMESRNISVKKVWFVDDKKRLTTPELIGDVVDIIRSTFKDVPVGGGTDAYFAEFNRNRFDASGLDFVTYAVCPQVHAFDNDSLTENMAAQGDTVESARLLYPGKEVHVSPITLKQRFNVVATGDEPPVPHDQLPPQVDVRQMSLFTAGWTLGSIATLAKAGAKAVTYYQTPGWRGIFQGEEENSKPLLFAGQKGDIYPVYHLLRFIGKSDKLKFCKSSHPLKFSGIIIFRDGDKCLVLSNHTSEALKIQPDFLVCRKIAELSEENMSEALRDENFLLKTNGNGSEEIAIELKPFSTVFLKVE